MPNDPENTDTGPEDRREALRQAVRDYVTANSTSLKSVALLCGIGESTFTAWLGGKYRGDNDKIDEKVAVWLASEKDFSRKKQAMPAALPFVHTPAARKFLGVLEHAQAMPDVAVIVGGAGVGKTSACLHYKATHPNVWHLTAEPSLASSYAMMEYLRETLGIPETAPFRVSRAITVKIQNTGGLIIIDEAQHLSTQALDQLRSLHDRAQVGLAFVGNEEVWRRLDGGGRKAEFAQLFSRVGTRVSVARSSSRDVEDILHASEIMDEGQRLLLKTIAAKPGALRQMTKVLRLARFVASGAVEELSEAHIAAAWHRLTGGEGGVA